MGKAQVTRDKDKKRKGRDEALLRRYRRLGQPGAYSGVGTFLRAFGGRKKYSEDRIKTVLQGNRPTHCTDQWEGNLPDEKRSFQGPLTNSSVTWWTWAPTRRTKTVSGSCYMPWMSSPSTPGSGLWQERLERKSVSLRGHTGWGWTWPPTCPNWQGQGIQDLGIWRVGQTQGDLGIFHWKWWYQGQSGGKIPRDSADHNAPLFYQNQEQVLPVGSFSNGRDLQHHLSSSHRDDPGTGEALQLWGHLAEIVWEKRAP